MVGNFSRQNNNKRIYGANPDTEEVVKETRKYLVMEKQAAEANLINNEGTTFQSGSF